MSLAGHRPMRAGSAEPAAVRFAGCARAAGQPGISDRTVTLVRRERKRRAFVTNIERLHEVAATAHVAPAFDHRGAREAGIEEP